MAAAATNQIVTHCAGDGILRIGMNRPEKKNALTLAMYSAMTAALEQAARTPEIRVVVLHGTADCFSSGNDLQDFMQQPPSGEGSPVFGFLQAIAGAEKPLLAAVEGDAVGIGTTLLLHCDLVCAGADARFQLPFVNLGLCPEAAASLLLPQLLGHQRAAELLLLGESFDAPTAQAFGLVNRVGAAGTALDAALALAAKLALQPPASVRLTKSLLKQRGARAVAETMSEEGRLFIERLSAPEAREALSAFFQRRRADFSTFR